MNREPLLMVCTCEIAGRVRGKGFPAANRAQRMKTGVGWIGTNTMISCFGPIGDTPFGALGDLILVPDETTEVRVDFGPDSAPEHFFLGATTHGGTSASRSCIGPLDGRGFAR